jgi:hypothetical protein
MCECAYNTIQCVNVHTIQLDDVCEMCDRMYTTNLNMHTVQCVIECIQQI